jgi:hypothetical protein
MRRVGIAILLAAGVCWGQSMTEAAAAAAGGSVGGVGGKKLSDGLSAIFDKVDQSTARAAKPEKPSTTPLLEVGRGVAKVEPGSVPPPPPLPGERLARRSVAPPQVAEIQAPVPVVQAPPPPQVTADDLRTVTPGMNRTDVLKMGEPAARITMVNDGHLVEVYSYKHDDTLLGRVRLSDGAVSSAEVR